MKTHLKATAILILGLLVTAGVVFLLTLLPTTGVIAYWVGCLGLMYYTIYKAINQEEDEQ